MVSLSKPKPRVLTQEDKRRAKQSNWVKVSAVVRTRDKGKCRACGKAGHHVHHIVYRSHGGKDEASNLILTCADCHARIHARVTLVTFTPYHPALTIRFERNTQWDNE